MPHWQCWLAGECGGHFSYRSIQLKYHSPRKKPVYYFFTFLLCLSPLVYAEPSRSLKSKIISLALLWWLELAVSVLLSKFFHVSWYAPTPKYSRLVGLLVFYSFSDVWQSKQKDLNIANEIYKIILQATPAASSFPHWMNTLISHPNPISPFLTSMLDPHQEQSSAMKFFKGCMGVNAVHELAAEMEQVVLACTRLTMNLPLQQKRPRVPPRLHGAEPGGWGRWYFPSA